MIFRLKMKVKRLVWIGAVAMAAVASLLLWKAHISAQPWETVATAEQVQEVVTELKQGDAYKIGGEYVARLEKSGVDFDPFYLNENMYQEYVINMRVVLDFVSTVTPGQIEIMKQEGRIGFTSLSPDQRKSFLRMRHYCGQDRFDLDVKYSTIALLRHRRGSVSLVWKGTTLDGFRPSITRFGLVDSSPDILKLVALNGTAKRDVVGDICRRAK